ncbi:MAG: 30S ribosomal protein S4 [Candidatus Paceibacterota bacterium]|jgi:small subunit ribosomal protein S4
MRIGPRYKIARRLGPSVFDKTQTQKFALSESRKGGKKGAHPKNKTEYGLQMLEKQRVRFTYGVGERQFGNYVSAAVANKGTNTVQDLYGRLERRLDNVVYRIGLGNSRQATRQMVSHGHILVNGRRVTIPSYAMSKGDRIRIREGSQKSPLFKDLIEKTKKPLPTWMTFAKDKNEWEVTGTPVYVQGEQTFDLSAVIEFYSR